MPKTANCMSDDLRTKYGIAEPGMPNNGTTLYLSQARTPGADGVLKGFRSILSKAGTRQDI